MGASAAHFLSAYIARTPITDELSKLQCRLCIITGKLSTQIDGVADTNAHTNHRKSSFQLVDGCGAHVQLERPDVVARSLRLFLEGLGLGVKVTLELDNL